MEPTRKPSHELRESFVLAHPDKEVRVREFVDLGLADHPDFVRFIEASIAVPFDPVAQGKAELFANRLLDDACLFARHLSHGVIAGHRCGIQSCDEQGANVYAEIEGRINFVRLDRTQKLVVKPLYSNPAYAFVKENFDAFEQICSKLDEISTMSKRKPPRS